MIVAFDTGMLSLALHQKGKFPNDPDTGQPVEKPRERIEHLVEELTKARATIVIPAPSLAEFLVVVGKAATAYIQTINRSARFDIRPFDEMAAIEAAQMFMQFQASGDKKGGGEGDWQKVKVDQQIVAVAKVNRAQCIYTSDKGIVNIAAAYGLACTPVWRLPPPPTDSQGNLFRDSSELSSEQLPASEQSPDDGQG